MVRSAESKVQSAADRGRKSNMQVNLKNDVLALKKDNYDVRIRRLYLNINLGTLPNWNRTYRSIEIHFPISTQDFPNSLGSPTHTEPVIYTDPKRTQCIWHKNEKPGYPRN